MADHYHPSLAQTQTTRSTTTTSSSLLRKLREHVSNSGQFFGVMTFVGTVLGLILFAPLIILTSPIWVPLCTVLFLVTTIFLSMCGFGLVAVAVLTWMYRYSKRLRPPGSDRGVQSKAMDAAPGA